MALSLREKLIGGFSGAVLAVGAALPGAIAPTTAQATDVSCPSNISVPCADIRGQPVDFVRTYAARVSAGQRVVLVYYGNDQETQDTANTVAEYFSQNGIETGLILADGENKFQIYIDAQAITNEFAAGIGPRQLGEHLNAALIRYREVAEVPEVAAQPGG